MDSLICLFGIIGVVLFLSSMFGDDQSGNGAARNKEADGDDPHPDPGSGPTSPHASAGGGSPSTGSAGGGYGGPASPFIDDDYLDMNFEPPPGAESYVGRGYDEPGQGAYPSDENHPLADSFDEEYGVSWRSYEESQMTQD